MFSDSPHTECTGHRIWQVEERERLLDNKKQVIHLTKL